MEVGSGETYTATDALGEDAGSLLQVLLGLGEFGGLEVVLGVGVAQTFEDFIVRLDALEEGHPILLGIRQPPDFGDGEHTRQELVLEFDAVVESLGPEVALHAEAVVFAAREAAQGIEVVNGGEIDHAIFDFQIIVVNGQRYFAFVKLNVNWQDPCTLYEYEGGELRELAQWDNMRLLSVDLI